MDKHDLFLKAIHSTIVVKITVDSKEKGIIERRCIPFDYGPSKKYRDKTNRYHFYDLDSPDGSHNLSILPEQLIRLELLDDKFEPGNFVKWKPNWFVERDWGIYS